MPKKNKKSLSSSMSQLSLNVHKPTTESQINDIIAKQQKTATDTLPDQTNRDQTSELAQFINTICNNHLEGQEANILGLTACYRLSAVLDALSENWQFFSTKQQIRGLRLLKRFILLDQFKKEFLFPEVFTAKTAQLLQSDKALPGLFLQLYQESMPFQTPFPDLSTTNNDNIDAIVTLIAQELCSQSLAAFMSLTPFDIQNKTPNFHKMARLSDQISYFFAKQILTCKTDVIRKQIALLIIKLIDKLLAEPLVDINTAMAVFGTLDLKAISRLELFDHEDEQASIKKFSTLFATQNNFKALRGLNGQTNAIPFFGIFIQDLTFSTENVIAANQCEEIGKCYYYFTQRKKILSERPFLKITTNLIHLIEQTPIGDMAKDKLHELSEAIKPRPHPPTLTPLRDSQQNATSPPAVNSSKRRSILRRSHNHRDSITTNGNGSGFH